MNTMKSWLVPTAICVVLAVTAAGCNTVKGAGRDIERGGEKIQGAAEKAQD